MSLLRQIQDAAIDSTVDLPTLLRKCKVLAARLGSEEFKRWIEFELSGYPDDETLPSYRVVHVNSKGHFSGPFGSGLRNADIPLSCVPEKLRKRLSTTYLRQPIAALAALVSEDQSGTLQEPWNPDIVVHVGQKIYEDMNCMQAWKVIPSSAIVAALDTVRTRVLNFALEIEAQNPSAGEAAPNSNPVPTDTVKQIFNMYITGNVQNLAPGSTDVRQTAEYSEGVDAQVFAKLLEAIKTASLEPALAEAACRAVAEMGAAKERETLAQRYNKFMSILSDHMQVLGPVVAPYLPALSALLLR
jgi:hypothetical protein